MVRLKKRKNKNNRAFTLRTSYQACASLTSWLTWHTIPDPDRRLAAMRFECFHVEQEQEPLPTSLSGIQAMVEQLAEECETPEEMEQILSIMDMLSSIQK